MACLLCGDAHPVVEELGPQVLAAEPHDEVPCEVDRVEFDMRQGVHQSDAACRGPESAALRHVVGWTEQRAGRPGGMRQRQRLAQHYTSTTPALGERAACRRLARGIGGGEDGRRSAGKSAAGGGGGQRARAAFSTSPTWPGTLTLCHTPRMMPVPSIRKVARSMPMYLRPYMLFSTQTPYFSHTSPLMSEPRMN